MHGWPRVMEGEVLPLNGAYFKVKKINKAGTLVTLTPYEKASISAWNKTGVDERAILLQKQYLGFPDKLQKIKELRHDIYQDFIREVDKILSSEPTNEAV